MDFELTLANLTKEDTQFEPSTLYSLSRLEPDDLESLKAIWTSIPASRRYAMLNELFEIAAASFEADFDSVFRWGLGDDEAAVRAICVEGLWENEDLSLMDRLLKLLKTDPADQVRAAAASSLGRFVLLCELGKLSLSRCQSVYATLFDTARDSAEAPDVRRRALESVAYITSDEVVILLQQAYDSPDDKMRMSAVFGMGRSADARWIDTVMGELFSLDPEMRYEAARACGELQARSAVPRLAELINDPDREIQEAALWALGQAGGDAARRLLQSLCEQGDEVMRSAAEAALQELELLYGHFDLPFYALENDESDLTL